MRLRMLVAAAAAAALLLLAGAAAAQPIGTEPIDGAFGFTLGDVYVPDSATDMTQDKGGLVRVEVEARIHTGFFRYHALWLEPDTQRIVQITATAPYPTRESAEEALASLLDVLRKKYGHGVFEDLVHTFHNKERSIHVSVSVQGSIYVLAIAYQDDALVNEAMRKAAERRYSISGDSLGSGL
ncbi:hypothetical protein [Oceanidesulfovibrio marinus]|uniref:Uncharacterized protein n=1 Tax=Oceanidesulfovibrio marinus TaxID=370038 RepID=A0ABX6ND04_9BACT|nr:hypothetical protein [Oceanidesulfovibrio marinus]QJT08477.1 hypothetical protein E8L03_05845 [Oceanidesulfovibrio marinus]